MDPLFPVINVQLFHNLHIIASLHSLLCRLEPQDTMQNENKN